MGYGIPKVDGLGRVEYREGMQPKSLQPLRRGLSLRERIHDRLRAAIISGELAPGTPVIEAELATRLGASRTPVREALRRLEAEGLLEPRGLRGSVVRELKSDQVECIFEIREALESLAARRAARTMRASELRRLEAEVDRMRGSADDANEMERHDTAFHDIILANANGERLKRMLTDLREELIAYRFLSLSDPERRRATIVEHDAIVDAIRTHDEHAAASRTAEHIANARSAVLQLAAVAAAPSPEAVAQ
jgi:DNA-binding GntR family transcriptional regulator